MQIKTEKPAKSTKGTCNTLFTRHMLMFGADVYGFVVDFTTV